MKPSSLRHFPLGSLVPDSPHAVVSSLPTMADVIGYEEGDPRVLAKMTSGYPRFVVHPYVARCVRHYLDQEALVGRAAVLISDHSAAHRLLECVEAAAIRQVEPDLYLVHVDAADEKLVNRLRRCVQHSGCGISSRRAEDILLQYGHLKDVFPEKSFQGDAHSEVESRLAEQIGCREKDLSLCTSGMNAFDAGFRAARHFQRSHGRHYWLQLGWLYLDSGILLRDFLGPDGILEIVHDVSDTEAILRKIRKIGQRLAAVVVEAPSNPLLHTAELSRIAQAVRSVGGVMVVDPSMASVYNVDVLPFADILVTSLTKYAAIDGDVLIGALALNSRSPFHSDLRRLVSRFQVAPYRRDVARLARQMIDAPPLIKRMNANAVRLTSFLRRHPAVRRVLSPHDSPYARAIAKREGSLGSVLSIELKSPLKEFYDVVSCVKGPSFGTRFTLLAPFLYLAHYDLVTSVEGRALLAEAGLPPDLIRISVGSESYESIEAVFAQALS